MRLKGLNVKPRPLNGSVALAAGVLSEIGSSMSMPKQRNPKRLASERADADLQLERWHRFPVSPGRGVINRNQDCISRTSLVWQESPSVCYGGSRCFFVKLKGTRSGVAVHAVCRVSQALDPELRLGRNQI